MNKLLPVFFIALFFPVILFAQTHAPKREFRGVWLTTVVNIDWPSKPGLDVETQKREMIRILDNHQRSGINAILLQVRPTADAFYAKSREPWSRFLTGKQGQAPAPFYDPLVFAIQEAHARGMELHAWFNPYRATFDLVSANTSPQHITHQKPGWFFTYGGRKLFNPGIPEVREYIVQVIMDVVRNYDIDGVHFDDYFYPYPEPGKAIPDRETFGLYGKGFASVDDWRRHNVDTLIHNLSDSIHAAKKYVKFGVSPFAIWRNKAQDPRGSASNGFDGYGKLYADARKWMENGWLDYINPQVYFAFYYAAAPFEKLTDWWSNNAFGKHVYIGHAAYRTNEKRPGWNDRRQMPDQIRYVRANNRIQGSVYFSSKSLTNNFGGVNDSLRYNFYRTPALQPPMLWLDNVAPHAPTELHVSARQGSNSLSWKTPLRARDGETAYGYVIYRFEEGARADLDNPAHIIKISFDASQLTYDDKAIIPGKAYRYVVTAIDRLKNESAPSNEVNVHTEAK